MSSIDDFVGMGCIIQDFVGISTHIRLIYVMAKGSSY